MVDPSFLGFPRRFGRAGVRNHVLVLGINGLVAPAASQAAARIAGSRLVATPYGRGQFGADKALHFLQLAGIGANPNNGAVLIVGADRKSADAVAEAIAQRSPAPVEAVTLDDTQEDAHELVARAVRAGTRLAREASHGRRVRLPLSELYLGLECGHSDASSGLAANPLAGAVADRLVEAGATCVVGETLEWLGAEDALSARGADGTIGRRIAAAVMARERAVTAAGVDLLGDNPGEENIRGGLSTIEEKSLGAIAKAGRHPVTDMLGFAQPPSGRGLHLMDGPSYSPESMTGFVASGTQMILFTTGPGNSYCSLIAPTFKLSANPAACARLDGQLDFDAGAVLQGRLSLDAAAGHLLAELIAVASGTLTWGEAAGQGAECFTRIGPSL